MFRDSILFLIIIVIMWDFSNSLNSAIPIIDENIILVSEFLMLGRQGW